MLGIPTLKLRGDYLAIVTISAAEILRYVGRLAKLEDFTGAAQGIPGSQYRGPFADLSFLPQDTNWTFPFTKLTYPLTGADDWWVRLVAWLLVALCSYFVFLLVRSPWGRLLRGIREDEDAIRSLGKNVFAVKMQALDHRWPLRRARRHDLRPALVDAARRDGPLADVLRLDGAAARWRGHRSSGRSSARSCSSSVRIFLQGFTDAVVPNSVMNTQQTEQFAWIVRRCRADAAGDLPTTRASSATRGS